MIWLLETVLASSLLILLVLLIRKPALGLIGARLTYLLWLLPAIRVLLPALPINGSIPTLASVLESSSRSGAQTMSGLVPSIANTPSVNVAETLFYFWIAGAALYFARQILVYHLFLKAALHGAQFLKRERRIDVFISNEGTGPLACGVIRRRIFLPKDFLDRYKSEEQTLAIAHEVAHHERGDILANFVALLFVSMQWFNPLAHYAYRIYRRDQELACDESVLASAQGEYRLSYGIAIAKTACAHHQFAACQLGDARHIKERLRRMQLSPISLRRRLLAVPAIVMLLAGAMVTTATSASRVQPIQTPLMPLAPSSSVDAERVSNALPLRVEMPIPEERPMPEEQNEPRQEVSKEEVSVPSVVPPSR